MPQGQACAEEIRERVQMVESGYRRRFEEEHQFGAFIERFRDEVRARLTKMISKTS